MSIVIFCASIHPTFSTAFHFYFYHWIFLPHVHIFWCLMYVTHYLSIFLANMHSTCLTLTECMHSIFTSIIGFSYHMYICIFWFLMYVTHHLSILLASMHSTCLTLNRMHASHFYHVNEFPVSRNPQIYTNLSLDVVLAVVGWVKVPPCLWVNMP